MGALHSKYSRVFDLLPELIFVLDKKGTILDYNASVSRELLGDGDEKSLHSIFDLLKGGTRINLSSVLHAVDADVRFRSQFNHSGSRIIDVELTLKKFDSVSPEVFVLIANDMTEQEKMELDLLRFSEVMQHTMSPIQITDAQGKIIFVNPAFERVSGYTKEELLGKNPNILNSGTQDEKYWRQVWSNILKGKEWVGQIQNRRKNGELFHTELVISPIVEPARDGRRLLGISQGYYGTKTVGTTACPFAENGNVRNACGGNRARSWKSSHVDFVHRAGNPANDERPVCAGETRAGEKPGEPHRKDYQGTRRFLQAVGVRSETGRRQHDYPGRHQHRPVRKESPRHHVRHRAG